MCVQLGSKYCFSSTIPPWIEEQIGFKLSKCHAAHKKDQLKVRMIWIQMKTQLKFTLRLLSLRWHGQKLLGRKKQPGKSGSVKCHSNTDRNERHQKTAHPGLSRQSRMRLLWRQLKENYQKTKPLLFVAKLIALIITILHSKNFSQAQKAMNLRPQILWVTNRSPFFSPTSHSWAETYRHILSFAFHKYLVPNFSIRWQ